MKVYLVAVEECDAEILLGALQDMEEDSDCQPFIVREILLSHDAGQVFTDIREYLTNG